jgi:hypothetical protein
MIARAHAKGIEDALARFQVKDAGIMEGIKQTFIGQPGRAFVEGPRTFSPGGMLSTKNVWWPSVKGQPLNWIGRAGTIAAPLMALSAMRSNPQEGHLSNALGALGGIAGSAYGFPALGMLGGPLLAQAGARAGRGLGHLLGSKPKDLYQ